MGEASEWGLGFVIVLGSSSTTPKSVAENWSNQRQYRPTAISTLERARGGEPDWRWSFWTPQSARPVVLVMRTPHVWLYDLANTVREIKMSLHSPLVQTPKTWSHDG